MAQIFRKLQFERVFAVFEGSNLISTVSKLKTGPPGWLLEDPLSRNISSVSEIIPRIASITHIEVYDTVLGY